MTDPADRTPATRSRSPPSWPACTPRRCACTTRKGLVSPRRTPGGTRRYSDADVARLRKVTHLTTELGLSLSGATHVLALEQTVVELLGRVDALGGAARRCRRGACARRCRRCIARYRRDLVPYTTRETPT